MPVPSFLDSYVPYLLERASQLLTQQFHAELAEEGFDVADWRILAVLFEASPLPVNDLPDRAIVAQLTTSHALTRLEGRGLAVRRADIVDRRHRLVELTPAGRQLTKRLQQRAERLERKAIGIVDPALAEQVERVLRSFIATLEV